MAVEFAGNGARALFIQCDFSTDATWMVISEPMCSYRRT
jgi:hypothetical protein